jgi:hypothetical protein
MIDYFNDLAGVTGSAKRVGRIGLSLFPGGNSRK